MTKGSRDLAGPVQSGFMLEYYNLEWGWGFRAQGAVSNVSGLGFSVEQNRDLALTGRLMWLPPALSTQALRSLNSTTLRSLNSTTLLSQLDCLAFWTQPLFSLNSTSSFVAVCQVATCLRVADLRQPLVQGYLAHTKLPPPLGPP